MPSIEVQGLSKVFNGRKAVDSVFLKADAGEILGVLGPNGSGKTTMLRMICGLLLPSSGRGRVLGHDIIGARSWIKRNVGYMTQRFSLYDDLTVRENLDFQARIYGVPERAARVREALERLDVAARPDQLARTLSGGWKQRLALEACTLHRPRILLLDEPTAGVDPMARREFWSRLQSIASDGATVLVSTHYMDEAERCDRIAIMLAGRLVATGTTPELAAEAGLTTFVVTGDSIERLISVLKSRDGVEQIVRLGNKLHVVGRQPGRLARALSASIQAERYKVEPSEPGIEDIFIYLTRKEQGPGA